MVNVNEKAPDFILYNTDLKPVKLNDFKGKVVVLSFFPAAFTAVCTKEMCTFRDSISKFNDMNAVVLGISVDPPFSNKAFKDHNKLNFDILSDYSREVVKKYGVSWEFPSLPGYILAKRAVFVVDKEGVVRYKWISDDPTVEPPYQEVEKVISSIS
jgi:peroxiredoxin